MRAIVLTRPDGGVDIVHPSRSAISWLERGGLWADFPPGFVDSQIAQQTADGFPYWAVVRYCRAMVTGGKTEAEAFEIIRDRDCGNRGTAFEAWDRADLPTDRWFRDAWRRSHNGGPIGVSIRSARKIQADRIKDAAKAADIDLKWPLWRQRIRKEDCPVRLKHIWPKGLGGFYGHIAARD
jgi:hypothetical protein